MNLKAIFTTILVVCSITLTNAQSKDILAKSAMLNADESFGKGDYFGCIKYLEDAQVNLGETNSRIQYLMVKSYMENGTLCKSCKWIWLNAEAELRLFFEVTAPDYVPEKYDEMLLAVSKVKKYIAEADEADKSDSQQDINESTARIQKDPTDFVAYAARAIAKGNLKDYQGALQDYDKVIELVVNDDNIKQDVYYISMMYDYRAFVKYHLKDYHGAIQDYSKAIELKPKDYIYYNRGRVYQMNLKDVVAAMKDFEMVIMKSEDNYQLAFSNYFIGNKVKAFEVLTKSLKDAQNIQRKQKFAYYDLAKLYSVDSNQAEAINAMKNAFEKGYNDFYWIENDEDFDNIRNSAEFKEMINTYKN